MTRLSPVALEDLKSRHPVDRVAGESVRLRRGSSAFGRLGFTGPCPLCSVKTQSKSAGRFECNAVRWVCANCQKGGDVIALVMARDGVDFRAAVDRLGGAGAAPAMTSLIANRLGHADHGRGVGHAAGMAAFAAAHGDALLPSYSKGWCRAKAQAAATEIARAREIARLERWWRDAAPFAATLVATYLAGRGLQAPPDAQLRYHADVPLFADGRENAPRLLHRGPAMLAAIWSTGKGFRQFCGLHITWLDPLLCAASRTALDDAALAARKGKLALIDPDTGAPVPSKKVRGSKAGGFIDLGGADDPTRLFAGEGIETTLAAYTALARAGRLRAGDAFRAAIDLGNLGGKAAASVPHPDAKDAAGRARRVPGPEPDLSAPAMPVPATVTELIGLGDGDSDAFTTFNALARFKARHALLVTPDGREQPFRRTVRTPVAPAGMDFNDWLNDPARAKD